MEEDCLVACPSLQYHSRKSDSEFDRSHNVNATRDRRSPSTFEITPYLVQMGGVGTRGRRTNAVLYIYIYPRASDNKTNSSLSRYRVRRLITHHPFGFFRLRDRVSARLISSLNYTRVSTNFFSHSWLIRSHMFIWSQIGIREEVSNFGIFRKNTIFLIASEGYFYRKRGQSFSNGVVLSYLLGKHYQKRNKRVVCGICVSLSLSSKYANTKVGTPR